MTLRTEVSTEQGPGVDRARILVLGAGGFLGSQLRRHLDDRWSGLTRLYVSSRPPNSPLAAGTRWITLQLHTASGHDVARLIGEIEPDAIVNCAGALSGTVEQLRSANVGLVVHLLAAAADRGIRLVQLGSAAEYGVNHPRSPLSEDSPCRPSTEYGRAKLAATQGIQAASRSGRVDGVVLRVFNPVGGGIGDQTLAGRAARLLKDATESGASHIELGDLGAYRDYLDARDVAEAAVVAATRPLTPGLVLNVGRGEAVESRDLIRRLARVAGFAGTIGETEGLSGRSASISWQQADVAAIGAALGWSARHTLDDAVRDLWESMFVARPARSGR